MFLMKRNDKRKASDQMPFVCYLGMTGFEKWTSKPQIRYIVQNI